MGFLITKIRFQSTLLQEERQKLCVLSIVILMISIHAPTRGATANKINYIADLKISIHAPTRGATEVQIRKTVSSAISIHAPTREATQMF